MCLGTPHYSIDEFERLRTELDGRRIDARIFVLVTTSRAVSAELADRGWHAELSDLGVDHRDRHVQLLPAAGAGVRRVS